MGKVGTFVGLSEAGPSTTSDAVTSAVATVTGEEEGCACPFTLTKKQRFQGFGICFGVGMLLSFLSLFFMLRPISFALLLSFGNITSYMSTGFLVGPRRQCKSACDPKRALASIIFFVAIASTIVSAIYVKSVILCLVDHCAVLRAHLVHRELYSVRAGSHREHVQVVRHAHCGVGMRTSRHTLRSACSSTPPSIETAPQLSQRSTNAAANVPASAPLQPCVCAPRC